MTKLLYLLLGTISLPLFQDYPVHKGKPTSMGIRRYVEEQSDSIIREYQDFVKDTLYNTYIYADDLSEFLENDSTELGWYYAHEIFITTQELFIAYELNDLSRIQRALHGESSKFVKATLVHELTHHYLSQIAKEMQSVDQLAVHSVYTRRSWDLNPREAFGRAFMEEGICDYVTGEMGEIIPPKRPYIPKTVEDLLDRKNSYAVKYTYAAHVLKPFFDGRDLKTALKMILHNAPPSYAEILDPDLYFDRLIPILQVSAGS